MPNARQINEGLSILLRYAKDRDAYMCANHDEVFLPGPPPDEISDADRKRLEELGIDWDGDGWHAFV